MEFQCECDYCTMKRMREGARDHYLPNCRFRHDCSSKGIKCKTCRRLRVRKVFNGK